MRRGIILAGGAGTRLHPMSLSVSKQLMPVFDKPMIYYPLSVLMIAGIREILVITTPSQQAAFRQLLGDGEQWGLSLQYAVQTHPGGIAEALHIAEPFLDGGPSALILGDNIFYGAGLETLLRSADARPSGATVFSYAVKEPQAYGIVGYGEDGRVESLEEKPSHPRSNHAVTGLYFFDGRASALARNLTPSARGELEITDLNRLYLDMGELHVEFLSRGHAWLDTGTPGHLLDAALFVRIIEERQGLKICCPEEIAWRLGYIDDARFALCAKALAGSDYGDYLEGLVPGPRGG